MEISEASKVFIRRARRKNNLPVVKPKQLRPPKLASLEGRYLTKVRRRHVYMLRMQNKTVREMCEELHAAKCTIIEDLRAIDAALAQDIDSKLCTQILNEKLLELEGLKVMAIQDAVENKGATRALFLNTATKINELQAKLLQDAGIIAKVASKHELTGKDGAPLPAASPLAAEIVISFADEGDDIPEEKVVQLPSLPAKT
jgi:hypothetical protein